MSKKEEDISSPSNLSKEAWNYLISDLRDVVSWRNAEHVTADLNRGTYRNKPYPSPKYTRDGDDNLERIQRIQKSFNTKIPNLIPRQETSIVNMMKFIKDVTIISQEAIKDVTIISHEAINYSNRDQIADLFLKGNESYFQISKKSGYSIKKLRLMVHRRLRFGSNFDKRGRSKLIDLHSDKSIIDKFNYIRDEEQLKSKEIENSIKDTIRSEVLATFYRRYPQSNDTLTRQPRKPTLKTVNTYYKSFFVRLLEMMKNSK